MYKDGITREVGELDIQRFKETGWVEVKKAGEEEEERKPKRKRDD